MVTTSFSINRPGTEWKGIADIARHCRKPTNAPQDNKQTCRPPCQESFEQLDAVIRYGVVLHRAFRRDLCKGSNVRSATANSPFDSARPPGPRKPRQMIQTFGKLGMILTGINVRQIRTSFRCYHLLWRCGWRDADMLQESGS